ncbi:neuronal calcium sensor 1-like [Symsagittifera roscoffensis]|uniref:neuronal calcium sensor 1-like n=1 Tax=Symsagittifera roscoffensis TaxID=84072 RepID=UPI00307B48A7
MIWCLCPHFLLPCCNRLCCCSYSRCTCCKWKENTEQVPGINGESEEVSRSTVMLFKSEKKISEQRRSTKAEKIEALLENTDFSAEELKRWHKKFKKENPSGKITKKEIQDILASRFPDGDPAQAAARVMQIFDRDQSGFLDFFELVTALSIARKGSKEDKLRLAFNMVDTDNSGTIDMSELSELMKALHNLVGLTVSRFSTEEDDTPDSHAVRMMEVFDKNNDNEVTFEEFCEGIQNNPNLAVLITNFASPEMICSDFVK